MQIVTEREFDEAVQQVADKVFDPLAESDEIHDFTMGVLDNVDDNRQERAQESLQRRTFHKVFFEHPFGDGPIDDLPTVVLACFIEHHDRTISLHYRDQHMAVLSESNGDKTVAELGTAAFYTAVKDEVWKRARGAVSEAPEISDPDVEA